MIETLPRLNGNRRTHHRVSIDGKIYESIGSAANALRISSYKLQTLFKKQSEFIYDNKLVKKLGKVILRKKRVNIL